MDRVIGALVENPRLNGASKLAGLENEWRLRDGSHPALYIIDDKEKLVTIACVCHRRDA